MEAPPLFFGYKIFAALDLLSSACNSEGAMTLLLHYRLMSSGDSISRSFFLFVVSLLIVTGQCMGFSKQIQGLNRFHSRCFRHLCYIVLIGRLSGVVCMNCCVKA
ncbi:hypothetical protein BV22DRAFT_1060744 [Leucogyrophana mollusca]|uniref:Uncharacterized protein n=1 Tax=Leucogyrophana mollusca TaxID=85980 RepID=A0ACB8BNW9_9AGAM|nr:hypothetical protein BV22DRAFT_1060744 [Leucogyrophana mollusca]